jgi:hypothetical protein
LGQSALSILTGESQTSHGMMLVRTLERLLFCMRSHLFLMLISFIH